jgi:glycosyltransferase involved in cell wall biosynthesis
MTAVMPGQLPRLALLPDFAEEQWPSMDLVAEMTAAELRDHHGDAFSTQMLRPPFRRMLRPFHTPIGRAIHNVERLSNRFLHYPRFLRQHAERFDLFHVCDHSYAQIVHALPPDRTGVFCHDLDTFGCLIDPARDRRPAWFRAMARRILVGMQSAAIVFYTTEHVREQIERHGLLDPSRLVKAPLGVASEFTVAAPDDDGQCTSFFPAISGPFLLHVGSCIPRKRIDVLLDTFAAVRRQHGHLQLLQIGGTWTEQQRRQIDRLKIGDAIVHYRGVSRSAVAAAYRRAIAVLVTSESEGFGLPVIEAMACGASVIASDLPVLREVGGDAAIYCPVGEIEAWTTAAEQTLTNFPARSRRERAVAQAANYSWERFGDTIADAYQGLLAAKAPASRGLAISGRVEGGIR